MSATDVTVTVVEHPVVADPDHSVWDAYAVRAWPTLVFISPDGGVIGSHSGEVPFESLARVVDSLLAELDPTGALDRRRGQAAVTIDQRPLTELRYPGNVLSTVDALFIADSGHNRVLATDRAGNVTGVFGSGASGLIDGEGSSATFHNPQGLAYDEVARTLYVADADNHSIRAIDLDARRVRTVAGTGRQLVRLQRSGPATSTALSSPWDLVLLDGRLLIAMAGTHQVWQLDLEQGTASVFAGTGHEALRDRDRLRAWFAQPMGLGLASDGLLVACAEAQAIRRIDLATDEVATLVGTGLFDFGDVDGRVGQALLQHPQAVTGVTNTVYVGDTYNNKIKAIAGGEVIAVAGSGTRGHLDGPGPGARFDEPGGLSVRNGLLYSADTNNHAIRYLDIEAGVVRTLQVDGLSA